MKIYTRSCLHMLWWLIALVAMLLAILISIGRIYAPMLAQYRPQLEAKLSEILAQPVQVASINAGWQGLQPVFKLKSVIVRDDQRKHDLLKVNELDVGIDLIQSLLNFKLTLGTLVVDGTELTAHQDESGKIVVDGMRKLSSTATTDNQQSFFDLTDWLFSEQVVAMKNITVRFFASDGNQFTLQNLHLNLRNAGEQHQIVGQAQLFNQNEMIPIDFIAHVNGNLQQLEKLDANVYCKVNNVNLATWLGKYLIGAEYLINEGTANFKIWAHWKRQQWELLESQFQLNNFKATAMKKGGRSQDFIHLGFFSGFLYPLVKVEKSNNCENTTSTMFLVCPSASTFSLRYAAGNLSVAKKTASSWQVGASHLRLVLNEHTWPEMQFQILLAQQAERTELQNIQLSYLDLKDLNSVTPLLGHFIPSSLQLAIQKMQPRGELYNLNLQHVAANQNTPDSWKVSTVFYNIQSLPWKTIPGVTGLSGDFTIDKDSGLVNINSQKLQVQIPSVFRNSLLLNQLQAQVSYIKKNNGWYLRLPLIQAHNQEASVNGKMALLIPDDGSSPTISLLAGVKANNVKHISNYVPINVLPKDVLAWLDRSITQVQEGTATVILNGRFDDFPFDHGVGTFLVDASVKGVDLDYWEQWPMARNLTAELIFAGRKMDAQINSGQIFNAQLNKIHAQIPYLGPQQEAMLLLNGTAQGDLKDGLQFLQESPLHATLGSGIKEMHAQGAIQLDLQLALPLENTKTSVKVAGDINVANGEFTLANKNLALQNIQGKLHFTQDGLSSQTINAQLFQQPVTLNFATVKTSTEYSTELTLIGKIDAAALNQQLKSPLLATISGTADYQANLLFANNTDQPVNNLTITSNLKGLKVDLPAPFTKAVNDELLTTINARFSEKQPLLILTNYGKTNLQISEGQNEWLLNIFSSAVEGAASIPKSDKQGLQVHLQHLYLSDNPTKSNNPLKPQDVAPLTFSCGDFRYKNKSFGKVAFKLTKTSFGASIEQLNINSTGYDLVAKGMWLNKQQTVLTGKMFSRDVSATLQSFGFSPHVISKNATISFNLGWNGVPYDLSLDKMNGNVSFELPVGRIIDIGENASVKMDLGRLLSFLSLQTLSRRLQLDFSDLTKQGFSFDVLKGKIILNNGIANVNKFFIDGPVAQVDMRGKIGLANKDYNLLLHITPHVTSSLPVVAALAAGPVAGAVTWVADKIISRSVQKIMTYTYQVTGPWENPVVQQIAK